MSIPNSPTAPGSNEDASTRARVGVVAAREEGAQRGVTPGDGEADAHHASENGPGHTPAGGVGAAGSRCFVHTTSM